MWITLKNSEFKESWNHLIDAQDYISIAIKIDDYEGVRNLQKKLESAEQSLFPNWALYASPSFVEKIGKCSVCGESFISCEHIENEVYMGKLCLRVDREIIRVAHAALVKNPRDKRCIITEISDDDGNTLDNFTREKTGKKVENSEGMNVSVALFSISTLDVF
jgi:hypothetical protein